MNWLIKVFTRLDKTQVISKFILKNQLYDQKMDLYDRPCHPGTCLIL